MATNERYPLSAVDDTLTVNIPRESQGVVTAMLSSNLNGAAAPVGFTAALEFTLDDTTWEAITFTKADQTTATSLTQDMTGSADIRAYLRARIRVTARTSGLCGARLEFRRGF